MKILILGANSYIAKQFIKTYHDKDNLKAIKRDENLKDYFDLKIEDFKDVDTVINFTAIVHNKKADESMHKKYNYQLVKYLADLAKEAKVSHFIQFSTIAVYGELDSIDADATPLPITPYGRYKLKADEYLHTLEDKDFIVSMLRPPIVYGKDAPGNMRELVALSKIPFPLPLGYTKNKRSILCITNLLSALDLIIEKKASGVFLLKDEESPSIGLLVEQIRTNSTIKMPIYLVDLMLKSRFGIFKKLFGNLIIDDSMTISKIGKYHKSSWQNCINKMV